MLAKLSKIIMLIVVVGFDQLTKALAIIYIGSTERISIIPGFFDLVLWKNNGAAFGMFSELSISRFILITLTITVLIVISWIIYTRNIQNQAILLSLTLICSGSIGNLLDRIFVGQVIDFLLIYYQNWYWPAFNIADSAISIGGIWLAVILFQNKK